jgi:hypothetical protein
VFGDGVERARLPARHDPAPRPPRARRRRLGFCIGLLVTLLAIGLAIHLRQMRGTTATRIYRKTRNLRAIRHFLDHTKLESTVRYPGIEVDDAIEIAEQIEV